MNDLQQILDKHKDHLTSKNATTEQNESFLLDIVAHKLKFSPNIDAELQKIEQQAIKKYLKHRESTKNVMLKTLDENKDGISQQEFMALKNDHQALMNELLTHLDEKHQSHLIKIRQLAEQIKLQKQNNPKNSHSYKGWIIIVGIILLIIMVFFK